MQRSPLHARRPARRSLARRARMARRSRLRLHDRLLALGRDSRARRDRATAAPQPRRHDLARTAATQARRSEHGHDARNHQQATVRNPRARPLRKPRQRPRTALAGARRCWPQRHPLHDGPAARHRRDLCRARRRHVRDPRNLAAARARARGHHSELPRQAANGDARRRRPRAAGVHRRRRRQPTRARTERSRASAAEPHRRGRTGPADSRRHRRLGRGEPADSRPRQPRAPVAPDRRARAPHCRVRVHAARAFDRAPPLRARRRAVARPAHRSARAGPGRGRWAGQRGSRAAGHPVARA